MVKKITFILIIFLTFSALLPPFEFPDEQGHFAMVQFVAEEGRVPKGKEFDLSNELYTTEHLLGTFRDKYGNNKVTYHPEYRLEYTNSYTGKYEPEINKLNNSKDRTTYVWREAARYPFLYYLYSAFWYRLSYKANLFTRLFAVRFGSILLTTATIYVIYLIGKEFFDSKKYALTLAGLAVLQPMFAFVGSGVNSDVLHNLLFTLLIYLSLRLIKHGWEEKTVLKLSVVISLDFLTKPQAYIMLPTLLLAVLLRFIQDKKLKQHVLHLVKVALLVFLFAGWYAIPKFFQQHGYINIPPKTTHPPVFIEFLKFSLHKLYSQNIVWYWGVFKWLGVVLPRFFWRTANRIVVLSGVGVLIYLIRAWRNKKLFSTQSLQTLFLILTSIFYILAIFFYDWRFARAYGYSFGVQARYYFPTISTHLSLLLLGFTSLSGNKRVGEWLRKVLVIFFISLHLAGLYTLASSYYDLWPFTTFITQASQYKPFFAKGAWWYLWISLYVITLFYFSKILIWPHATKAGYKNKKPSR